MAACVNRAYVLVAVDNLYLGVLLYIARLDFGGAFLVEVNDLYVIFIGYLGFDSQRFEVENYFSHVLFYAGHSRKLVLYAAVQKPYSLRRRTGERGQEYSSKAVAYCKTEALFKRFDNDLRVRLVLALFHFDFGHIHLDHYTTSL